MLSRIKKVPTGFSPALIQKVNLLGAKLKELEDRGKSEGFLGLKLGTTEFQLFKDSVIEAEDEDMMWRANGQAHGITERTRDAMRSMKILLPPRSVDEEGNPEETDSGSKSAAPSPEVVKSLLEDIDTIHTELGNLREALRHETEPDRDMR